MPELSLEYAFIPTPSPIRASAGGANPNTIDLRVTLSPPGVGFVTLRKISIQIPVGGEIAGDLSDAVELPQPVGLAGADGWGVSVDGSVVSLVSDDDDGTTIGGPISFTLPKIAVNETEGTVPITVTEYPPEGARVTDAQRYSLFKEATDRFVASFNASPATLYDLDQAVTLSWTCTDQGDGYGFMLHAGSWSSGDCLHDLDQCLGCPEGAEGILSPPLAGTTTFTLDVIGLRDGDLAIVSTLQLTVQVIVPTISQDSKSYQYPAVGGRIVRLHWLARDADFCSVRDNGVELVSRAPVDTYVDGFLVVLGSAGVHLLSVVAHTTMGNATATLTFSSFLVQSGRQVALEMPPSSVAITTDSTQARVGCVSDTRAQVVPIDLATAAARPAIALPAGGPALYLSRDATRCALITNPAPDTPPAPTPTFYSLDPFRPLNPGYALNERNGNEKQGAFSPDATRFITYLKARFMGNPRDGHGFVESAGVAWTDVEGGGMDGLHRWVLEGVPGAIAALNSEQALVTIPYGYVVQLTGSHGDSGNPTEIDVPYHPWAVEVSPDGSLALVAYTAAGAMGVIRLGAGLVLEPEQIAVGAAPSASAFTPDGAFAFVANHNDATVSVIDMGRRIAVATIPVPAGPQALAMSPDGNHLVVACDTSSTVVVL